MQQFRLQELQRAEALQQVSDDRLEAAVQEGLREARERQSAPGLPSASAAEPSSRAAGSEDSSREASSDADANGSEPKRLEPSNSS